MRMATLAIGLLLLAACAAHAQNNVQWYVLLSARNRPDSRPYLAHENNDGVSLRRLWRDMNPQPGEYDWSYFDAEIAKVVASGKGCMLRVLTGVHAPAWVYDAGAAQINTSSGVMPVPYDPVMLKSWYTFVRAMGERYGNVANVRAVHVAGPTWRSAEMHLPSEVQDLPGYTHLTVARAWKDCIDVFGQAFPQATIVVDLSNAVANRDNIPELVAGYTAGALNGRGALSYNSLSCSSNLQWRIPNLLVFYASFGAVTGAQMVSPSRQWSCSLEQAIARSSALSVDFLEIYESDSPRAAVPR